jgi:substrate-binding family protein
MLLATAERDSHADETSDGHLGGLDVHIVPMPADAASTEPGLKNVRQDTIDIAVVLGTDARAKQAVAALDPSTVILSAGTISPGQADAETTFAQRFEAAYGTQPDLWAAQGYNAARRVELAVRKLGGVNDRSALAAALAVTENGIDW